MQGMASMGQESSKRWQISFKTEAIGLGEIENRGRWQDLATARIRGQPAVTSCHPAL